ncbi:MAG: enoyl-CoA hydratase/isomerase family protein [Burkholderiales bacterium]
MPLPPPPPTSDRTARERYLRLHAIDIYDRVTDSRRHFVRVDELCRRAAAAFPELLPGDAALAEEAPRLQKDKRGLEIDQGLFLSAVLADPIAGAHLCHAMLLPHPRAEARLAEFERAGELDLGGARVHREGRAAVVTMNNPRFLNAEDESTLEPLELAIDLALLDRASEICVLRGAPVAHPRYEGKRLFGAGINLTHLYQGKIRYLWYLLRDLGLVNKLYRGLARPEVWPEVDCIEKLWIGALEGFAIGGHCQTVLTLDYVLAAEDAYMTLPARKEGIIPGAANLRLSRFVGARLARQAVMAERRFDCASPEGRLICDEIVPAREMDAALARTVAKLTGSGVVSASSNRRAFRIVEEPLDSFRRYMSVYAREQAHCHFSPALIANLERNWNAASRRA